ncbi:MAG: nitrogen fixation protein NifW [Methylobacter sp.]|nr:MAG: nitrogen fixation protein NifW [Methylobacter sp.]PPD24304.1 MAG: nitrogen fixation protein NifW [Methylobacter sp.]PPD35439.1 MAG: nitrogen fixation protein NifW [Methylomonas sp.]
MSLEEDLEVLESTEDVLEYFELEYDQTEVHVNRLHIVPPCHNYLADAAKTRPDDEAPKRVIYRKLPQRTYQDLVESDVVTEKVFKVFHMAEPQSGVVALSDVKTL